MKFEQHAEEALNSLQARNTTVGTYRSLVRGWALRSLAETPLRAITRRHVDSVLADARAGGCSERTVSLLLCALRSVFSTAVAWGRMAENPADGIRIRVGRRGKRALGQAERDALDRVLVEWVATGPRKGMSQRDEAAAFLRVLLWTGLRQFEAQNLRPSDYDVSRRVLAVPWSKSDSGVREVDVPDLLAPYLESRKRQGRGRKGERLLPRLSRETLLRSLARACEEAGVERMTLHGLRHTRITGLLLAGAPVSYVSRQAGHASEAFTLKEYDQTVRVATEPDRRRWANL